MNVSQPEPFKQRKRAAIYARFSTDLQNERSIEDQFTLCRAYADCAELEVIETHHDRARSGGSIMGRDGLLRLLDRAREAKFDVVIVEALDRLSRDMEDLAGIHKRLSFLGIEIRAVHEGVVNTVIVGLRGLVGQLYREDNAQKVRRGQAGRVGHGLNAGGLTYGYTPLAGEAGKRLIVEDEAIIIRRIFEEYAAGRTPRDIARNLNRDHVPPPRGKAWNASTINGNTQRGTGIIQNELYAGRLVWNKVRMIRDPDTGKRVSRPNERSNWQISNVPDLAIVSQEIFTAVQTRKKARAVTHPSQQRRPRHILSGLLRCGACGAGMSTNGKDKSGRIRIRCSAATESGTCGDGKTFYLDSVEKAALSGLRSELRHPKVIAEYVKTYHEERKRLAKDVVKRRSFCERRIGEMNREIDRLGDGIAKGRGDPQILGHRMKVLVRERSELNAELEAAPVPENIVTLHPAALARYEQQLTRLDDALGQGIRTGDSDAAEAIRDLVDTVKVYRDSARLGGVEVEISGRLTALLGEAAFPNRVKGVWGKMVAEEGLEPPTQGL